MLRQSTRVRRPRAVVVIASTILCVVAINTAAADAPPMRVAVSIAPLRSLVEPMLPAGSEVSVLLPTARSPHGMELAPSVVHAALAADILFHVGAIADPAANPLAAARRRAGAASVTVIDPHSDADLDHDHSHHEDHDHGSAWLEHAWMDPAIVAEFVPRARAAIEAELSEMGRLDDAERARIAFAERSILRDVAAVASAYDTMLTVLAGRPVVSLHGSLDALLTDHGASVASPLLVGHGSEPSPRALHDALARAADTPGGLIVLIDSPAPPRFAALIETAPGVRIARIDPIAREDWSRLMRDNLHAILLAASPGLTSPRE